MGGVDEVSVDAAPRTIISKSVLDFFPAGSVPVSDDVIKFTVAPLFCQLGRRFWVLLLLWLK